MLALVAAASLLLGLSATSPARAADWREYTSSGRQWREKCDTYSSTVVRCRTEIRATVASWNGRRFVTTTGWAFNNLLYKPSPRAQWVGNPLATPGEHTIDGRRWKTECETAWTGRNGCRSMILADVVDGSGGRYRYVSTWVFNSAVQFLPSSSTPPTTPPIPDPGPAPDPTPGATLAIATVGHKELPTGGLYRYFAPIRVTGRVTGSVAGTEVSLTLTDYSAKVWGTTSARTDSAGRFTASLPPSFAGWAQVVATLGPDHEPAARQFTILPASLTQAAPTQIDPLSTPAITGRLIPAVAGVTVQALANVAGTWQSVASATTAADGSYAITWNHNRRVLGAVGVRVRATTAWGNTFETGVTNTITRMRWPNTVITPTTSDEVSSTYRAGCPVSPGNLRTIRINQQGMDGTIHRGEIIVRADLAAKVADSFEQVFAAGFPVAQMRNPNVWGGSDTSMMAANNTSAFNCRRVVGNPTALSPHSYGKAVDFNPVQNPYRDPNGKWWPSATYSVNRPASVPGLHTASSASVKAFQGNGFTWFSGWDWHHFEYPNRASTTLTARPGAPSPTTAGDLDDRSLPQPDGWQGEVRDGSPDEGFTGNGTWLHAVDPATKGTDMLAVGCAPTTTDAPRPVAALEGNLTADGRPGISVALQFASEAEATRYFGAWQSQMQACVGDSATELGAPDATWLGRWDVDGTRWSEAAGQRGDTVKLTLLDDDLTVTDLEGIAANF
ncbi:M15 family metallopeptidase [Tessaracoccus antarcticus]|uniref:M15 family peptidase n=1 Tax=Tessaracoccus antarcticus TaxID=2479848 RepID=A0A3M0GBY7_9ACTN|nr:M15 family metallopeptidase [Tessaracoccus antarcticus]RMB61927.1 M15 family peptidase [Tessaracoccus antarcticus]